MDGTFRIKADLDPVYYHITKHEMAELKLVAKSGAKELFFLVVGIAIPALTNVVENFLDNPTPQIVWVNFALTVGSLCVAAFAAWNWRRDHLRSMDAFSAMDQKSECRMKIVAPNGAMFVPAGEQPGEGLGVS